MDVGGVHNEAGEEENSEDEGVGENENNTNEEIDGL